MTNTKHTAAKDANRTPRGRGGVRSVGFFTWDGGARSAMMSLTVAGVKGGTYTRCMEMDTPDMGGFRAPTPSET